MPDKAWKATERRVCRALGLDRIPVNGRPGPDGSGDWLCVQIKHRKKVAKFLADTLATIRRQARPDQLGVVVLHEHGGRGDGDLVMMTLADFAEWFGGTKTGDK